MMVGDIRRMMVHEAQRAWPPPSGWIVGGEVMRIPRGGVENLETLVSLRFDGLGKF